MMINYPQLIGTTVTYLIILYQQANAEAKWISIRRPDGLYVDWHKSRVRQLRTPLAALYNKKSTSAAESGQMKKE